jgi:F-type H+-transporting ATPase subunit a
VKSRSPSKQLLLGLGFSLLVMVVAGCGIGAVGSAIRGSSPFVPQPEIHLPTQPIFPAASRDCHLGLAPCPGEVPKYTVAAHGAAEDKPHFKPLDVTEFAITNTMLSAGLASIVLILFFVLGGGRGKLVPGRLQALVEILVERVLDFATGVVGAEMARKAFPVAATIFFFVLFNALLALFPFYQFLGFVKDGEPFLGVLQAGEIKAHLLRSPGTDINMPLALALVSFVFVEYWGLRSHGFAYLKKFFAVGNLLRLKPTGLIDVFVGFLELVSELVRVVSFTFRLFGNMTAGEILVVMVTFLAPFVLILPFLWLELLVGLIQAVIFGGLTLVFLSVAVAASHEEHH